FQREHEWLLKGLGQPAQKTRRVGAINDAVVVGERKRQHQPRLKMSRDSWRIRIFGGNRRRRGRPKNRFVLCAGEPQDRDLRSVDDRREKRSTNATQIRNGENSAF